MSSQQSSISCVATYLHTRTCKWSFSIDKTKKKHAFVSVTTFPFQDFFFPHPTTTGLVFILFDALSLSFIFCSLSSVCWRTPIFSSFWTCPVYLSRCNECLPHSNSFSQQTDSKFLSWSGKFLYIAFIYFFFVLIFLKSTILTPVS